MLNSGRDLISLMNERKAAWTIAALAPIMFVFGVVVFILSLEVGKTSTEPDIVEMEGFLVMLAMTMLSILCGLVALVLWLHHRRGDAVNSLHL